MAGLNKVMLIGNAGKDAELRYLSTGTAQAQFSLAVNRNTRNQEGNWEEQTEWFNIVLWREAAERQAQYITKGKLLYVEGRFQTRSWDNDQGVKQYRTEVVAERVQILERRTDGEGGGQSGGAWGDGSQSFSGNRGGAAAAGAPQRGGGFPNQGGGDMEPDDLPFE
ncbi:MAG: single-stranded DNA-binding protein [Dehalococcoidia bacterium]